MFVNSGGYRSVEPHLRAFDAATGNEQWRYDTGSVSKGTPAIADGRVFIAARDGLHAIDAADGSQQFVVPDGRNEWGVPAVADGTVYIVNSTADGSELLAIDAMDGTIRWRKSAGGMDDSPPVVTKDAVFVGIGNTVVGLDPDDGTETIELGAWGTPAAGIGNTLYATDEGTLYAADIEDGRQLWTVSTEQVQVTGMVMHGIGGVVPVDGAVYVSAADAFYGIGPA